MHAMAWVDAFHDYGHQVRFEEVRRQIGKGGDQLMPVFMTAEENFYVSSSLVKEVASLGGDVSGLVPDAVRRALADIYRPAGGSP